MVHKDLQANEDLMDRLDERVLMVDPEKRVLAEPSVNLGSLVCQENRVPSVLPEGTGHQEVVVSEVQLAHQARPEDQATKYAVYLLFHG